MKREVVYLHKKPATGQVFYVGSGSPERPYSKKGRTEIWKKTVHELGGFDVEVYKTRLRTDEALHLESCLIKLYGRIGIDINGVLINKCSIGNNHLNCKHSEETKAKISLANKSKPKSNAHRNNISTSLMGKTSAFKGRKHTDATKSKMSEARRKRITKDSTRQKMSLSHLGKTTKRVII